MFWTAMINTAGIVFYTSLLDMSGKLIKRKIVKKYKYRKKNVS